MVRRVVASGAICFFEGMSLMYQLGWEHAALFVMQSLGLICCRACIVRELVVSAADFRAAEHDTHICTIEVE